MTSKTNRLALLSLLLLMVLLVLLETGACVPRARADAPEIDPINAAQADAAPQKVGAKSTETLEEVGRHKRCGAAPGLAGWLLRDRKVWSLANVLDGKKGAPAKGVLIGFFATWCEQCEGGLKAMEKTQAAAQAAGVHTILVAVPEFTKDVGAHLKTLGVELPVIKDKFGGIMKQWLLDRKESEDRLVLPRTVLVNDTQQIARIYGAEGEDFQARILEDAKRVSTLCRPGKR